MKIRTSTAAAILAASGLAVVAVGGPVLADHGDENNMCYSTDRYGNTVVTECMHGEEPGTAPPINGQPSPEASETSSPTPTPSRSPAPVDSPQPAVEFADTAGNPHADNIRFVAEAGITTGYPDGTYRPLVEVTRGQMATFLARAQGLEPSDNHRFSDVPTSSTHARNIAAVADAGISLGRPDGTYGPEQPVTRAQMAAFINRAFGPFEPTAGTFTDLAGVTQQRDINALKAAGIAGGYSDGTYRPSVAVNRGQMATFIARALNVSPS
jgi:hypothetical protein